jgi:hypothetical protein
VNGLVHTCCGKVETVKNGQVCLGYVTKENANGDLLTVLLETDEVIKLKKPYFNAKKGLFEYSLNCATSNHAIKQYWPTPISVTLTGQFKMTLNRVTFDSQNNMIINRI